MKNIATENKLPPLPYSEWSDTKTTLHLFFQIVGKLKLAFNPKSNHWWHIPLFVNARGLDTGPIPYRDMYFQISFDFIEHKLVINASDGRIKVIFLNMGLSVAEFYDMLWDRLAELGVPARIKTKPYKMESSIPFDDDTTHRIYDREYVSRYWKILTLVDKVFKEFSGKYYGKTCPVQLYWHSMDLTVTLFSGKKAEPAKGMSNIDREAYNRELISFGFWPGDPEFEQAAFYSYTWPSPDGLDKQPIKPEKAYWQERNGSPMALYNYSDWRKEKNPEKSLMEFLDSAFDAGAGLANWKLDR